MSDPRPNVILIMTDQQRYDTIAALGFPHMDTPHLDRLVREGIAFSQCFVSAASCAPTRASLFTGAYPHTTGIYNNGDTWRHAWVEALAEAGYYCVNIGKMHTSPPETPLGFHERFVVENKDRQDLYLDRWDMELRAQGVAKPGRRLYRQRADYQDRLGALSGRSRRACIPTFSWAIWPPGGSRAAPRSSRSFSRSAFQGHIRLMTPFRVTSSPI